MHNQTWINEIYITCKNYKRRNNLHNGLRDDGFERALFEKLNMKLIMTLFRRTGILRCRRCLDLDFCHWTVCLFCHHSDLIRQKLIWLKSELLILCWKISDVLDRFNCLQNTFQSTMKTDTASTGNLYGENTVYSSNQIWYYCLKVKVFFSVSVECAAIKHS